MPVNNSDVQKAEMLNKILDLTNRVIQGGINLDISALQANKFASSLDLIHQKAIQATADLARLNQELLKVASSVDRELNRPQDELQIQRLINRPSTPLEIEEQRQADARRQQYNASRSISKPVVSSVDDTIRGNRTVSSATVSNATVKDPNSPKRMYENPTVRNPTDTVILPSQPRFLPPSQPPRIPPPPPPVFTNLEFPDPEPRRSAPPSLGQEGVEVLSRRDAELERRNRNLENELNRLYPPTPLTPQQQANQPPFNMYPPQDQGKFRLPLLPAQTGFVHGVGGMWPTTPPPGWVAPSTGQPSVFTTPLPQGSVAHGLKPSAYAPGTTQNPYTPEQAQKVANATVNKFLDDLLKQNNNLPFTQTSSIGTGSRSNFPLPDRLLNILEQQAGPLPHSTPTFPPAPKGSWGGLGYSAVANAMPTPVMTEAAQMSAMGMFPTGKMGNMPNWFPQANKKAQYFGFQPEDLRSINTEASSGISKLSYQSVDEATGALKNLNLTVDRTGNVLVDTQKRFRDFFSEVGRNTVEFLKWSVAVSLVLGPLQKFSELMQTAIENESKLADISVTLASGQTSVAQVFSASAEIANKAGEEINTVLDAYQIAYRAIGGAVDPTARFAQANKLLSDSMVLSKLTGMDEAKAIDTLSAALRQSFGEGALGKGVELLDKWVATTKTANVDLETLATGFAIVGDAADAAGLSVDRLNGLIAAIAETGVASGKEVANAARAMISGFQSDQAKKLLSNLGVATESGGEARSFDDIVSQLAQMRVAGKEGQAGGLSDEQFSKLTLTLGGGSRRQAVWATLIENYARVGEVAEASSKASGDAQDAMAKKTAITQTAITRLGNAFQTLANNLGTKGGMLDNFKMLVEFGTTLVKIFDTLSGSVGKAFPVALAGIGVASYLGGKSPETKLNASIGGLIAQATIPMGASQEITKEFRDARARRINASPFTAIGSGLLAAAVPAVSNLADESLSGPEKGLKVAGDVIGGLIGAAIGSAFSAGLAGPAGAVIGVTIAESFTSAIIADANKDYSGTWGKLAAKVQGIEVNKEGVRLTPGQQQLSDAQKALGKYNLDLGQMGKAGEEASQEYIAELIKNNARVPFEEKEKAYTTLAKSYGKKYTPRKFEDLGQEELIDLAISSTTGEIKTLLQGVKEGIVAVSNENKISGLTQSAIDTFYKVNQEVVDTASSSLSANVFKQFSEGAINKSGLTRGLTASKNLNTIGTNWYQGFGQGQDLSSFFEKTGRITAFGSEEDISAITTYSNEIFNYDKIINDATKSDEEHTKAIKDKAEALKIVTTLFEQNNQAVLAQAQLAPVVDIYGYNKDIDKQIAERAKSIKKAELDVQVQKGVITQAQADAKLKETTPFLTQMSDTNYGYYGKGEVDQQSYEQARDLMVKEGTLPRYGKDKGVQIQSYDLKSTEFNNILTTQYPKMLNDLVSKGYKEEKSDIIPVLNDKILPQMQLDTKVMSLLLQQIADNTKGMSGEFNLPEGMSFNIPYTWLSQANKGTGELLKNLPGSTATPTVGGSMLAGYEETPFYGEVKADLYPSKPNAVQNYDWEAYAKLASGGNIEGSPLSVFKRLEQDSLANPYGFNSGRGTYAPGEGFTAPDAGTGISAITDRLNVLNNSLQEFADRPINLTLNTTSVLTMDSKVIGEAVSRYIGIKLSALGGTFVGAKPVVGM